MYYFVNHCTSCGKAIVSYFRKAQVEPVEKVFLDVPEDKVGIITEKLSGRKGKMTNLRII